MCSVHRRSIELYPSAPYLECSRCQTGHYPLLLPLPYAIMGHIGEIGRTESKVISTLHIQERIGEAGPGVCLVLGLACLSCLFASLDLQLPADKEFIF